MSGLPASEGLYAGEGGELLRIGGWFQVSGFRFQVSRFMFHVSCFMFHVTCFSNQSIPILFLNIV
jgi:hypothetical protein